MQFKEIVKNSKKFATINDVVNNLDLIADIVKESSLKKNAHQESNNVLSTGTTSFQHSKIRGLTPPINGEKFDIKRSYQFRASTLKKLNQLKC